MEALFRSIHSESIIFKTTTDGAVDALSRHKPACRKDQANAAADALPCRPPKKTFGALRFRASLFTSVTLWAPLFLNLALSYSSLIFSSLTLSAFYTSSTLIPLHQILVCETLVLFQSCQCNAFRSKLVGGPTKTMLVA